ncbi:MAG: dehydrogenase, partial [Gemmataceae bacterium]|nr:dehydrogenase [Gemmataceae bacterium]
MHRYLLSILLCLTAASIYAQDAPLPARVAAAKMSLPPGFKATLFAGEPDIVQPIGFCFDDRGRVWVAECLSYPNWQTDPKKGKDRIVILEDTDGDGVHDKRTVFADNIANISGIQYGFGGVWVCAIPNLLFIPIKDDKPAGPAQIVLDGWDTKARHNVFNSPTWGPDGWLYGCNGILSNSKVGAPGTPDKDRVSMNCGVWRYHPTKKKFEVVAHGTTNPWGLAFDEHGEMFITNCVIDHLFHIVPGGHYQRMFGNDLNPHVYKLMPSICDHIHWGGGSWTSSRAPLARSASDGYKQHSEAGGGHAHSGCMIYLGDNWPNRYRNGVFMCNLHGNRINHDILERNGSTYVARHAKDFMHANDPWFRGIAIHYGPDGGVYVADWTDTGECHNYQVADKTNGRIFKITYGDAKPFKGDLAKMNDLELAKLVSVDSEWHSRHARRILHERSTKRKIEKVAIDSLSEQLANEERFVLRALWTLRIINELDDKYLLKYYLKTGASTYGHHIRAWAIRFILEDGKLNQQVFNALDKFARQEISPLVRLHFASSLQRVSLGDRYALLEALAETHVDSDDRFLPLMYWFGLEPLFSDAGEVRWKTPLLREFSARRIAEANLHRPAFDEMLRTIEGWDNPARHRDILRGISDGLIGRKNLPMPKRWKDTYPLLIESPLPEVRERALALAVQFGDERAFTLLRKIVPDREKSARQREDALKTLLFQQKADLVPMLHDLLGDDALRRSAIRGLAAYDDAKTPTLLLAGYPKWDADERTDAIQTLSSRSSYAIALLDAIDAKTVARGDISSFNIRQLQTLKSPELNAKLTKIIGEVRPASADKAKLMAKYKADLKPNVLKQANLANGRAIYNKACASCHRLFGEGG